MRVYPQQSEDKDILDTCRVQHDVFYIPLYLEGYMED